MDCGSWGPTKMASVETEPKVGDEANRVPPHMRDEMASVEAEPKVGDEANRVPPHQWREKESTSLFGGLAAESFKRVESEATAVDQQMFLDFEDCFSKHDHDTGWTHLIEHEMDTGPTPPFRSPLRSTPKAIEEKMNKYYHVGLARSVKDELRPWRVD